MPTRASELELQAAHDALRHGQRLPLPPLPAALARPALAALLHLGAAIARKPLPTRRRAARDRALPEE